MGIFTRYTGQVVLVAGDTGCGKSTQVLPHPPRQSLRRGRQKSFPPQGSDFQKSNAYPGTLFIEFTPSNTLAWHHLPQVHYIEAFANVDFPCRPNFAS